MSLLSFLQRARKHVQAALTEKTTLSLVIGNESADLDSVISALTYGYLQSDTFEQDHSIEPHDLSLIVPVANLSSADLALHPELTTLLDQAKLKPSDLLTLNDLGPLPLTVHNTRWTVVDHNVMQGALGEHYRGAVVGVIDHHDDEHIVSPTANPRIIEKAGSCTSLVVNHLRARMDASPPQTCSELAHLALGPILIDTVCLTDSSKTIEADRDAVIYLEGLLSRSETNAQSYDRKKFYDSINAAKSDLNSLTVNDILRKDYKQWTEGAVTLGISSVVSSLEFLDRKEPRSLPEASLEFARERRLDLFAIMTAYVEEEVFTRQLLLLSTENGNSASVADRFVKEKTRELVLEEVEELSAAKAKASAPVPWLRIWKQGNVSASRKQVGPMLRAVMR